jgi:putative redox protein
MYSVEVTGSTDSSFKVKSKDYEFTIDIKGKGINPSETLLASLASCIGVYLRKYAEGAKLELSEFVITAQAQFPKEPPFCFKEIKASIDLKGLALDERRKKAILEFIKKCPVHHTLEASAHVEIGIL